MFNQTELDTWAIEQVIKWAANPNEIHKRPPFKVHSFDTDDRWWVVGSTRVSVCDLIAVEREIAEQVADTLNKFYRESQ